MRRVVLQPSNKKGEEWIIENLTPTDGVVRGPKKIAQFIYENDGSLIDGQRWQLQNGHNDFEIIVATEVNETSEIGVRLPFFHLGDFRLSPL